MADALSQAELRRHAQDLLDGKAKAMLEQNQLTMRVMRKLLEDELGLPEGSLNSRKKDIAAIVKEALELEPVPRECGKADASGGMAAQAKVAKKGASEKENLKPAGAQADSAPGAVKKADKTTKPRCDEHDNDEAAAHGGRGAKGKGKSGKRAAAREEEEEDGENEPGGTDEEAERPKKRAKKGGRGSPGPAGGGGGGGGGKAKSLTSRVIEQMKDVCKRATIKIAPTLYTRNKTVAALEDALSELLARHGLNAHSGDKEIGQVRRQLERDRDLEGIDTSNIISLGVGRPRRAAAASINFREMFKQPKVDSDEEEEEEDEGEEEEQERKAAQAKQRSGGGKGRGKDDGVSDGDDDGGSEEGGSEGGSDDGSGDDVDSGSEGRGSEDLAAAAPRSGRDRNKPKAKAPPKAKASSKATKRNEGEAEEEVSEGESAPESEDLVDVPAKGAGKAAGGKAAAGKARRTAVVDSDGEDGYEGAGGGASDGRAGEGNGRGKGSSRKDGAERAGSKAKADEVRGDEEEEEKEPLSGKKRVKDGKAAGRSKAKAREVVEDEDEEEEEEEESDSAAEDDDSDFEADDDDD